MKESIKHAITPHIRLKLKITSHHIFIFTLTLTYLILMAGSKGHLGGNTGLNDEIGSLIEIGIGLFFSLPLLVLDMIPIVISAATIVFIIFDKPIKTMWLAFLPLTFSAHLLYYILQISGFHISWQLHLGTFLLIAQIVYYLIINEKNKRSTENFKTLYINFNLHKYNMIIMILLIALIAISLFIPLLSPIREVRATLEASVILGKISPWFSDISSGIDKTSGVLSTMLKILTLFIKLPFIIIAFNMIRELRRNREQLVLIKKRLFFVGMTIFWGTPFLMSKWGISGIIIVPPLNHLIYISLILWGIAEMIYVKEIGQLLQTLGSANLDKYRSYIEAVRSSAVSLNNILNISRKIPLFGKKIDRILSKSSKIA